MLGLGLVVQHVREWPVASQQRARRNAMLAATDCAARRAEREDVADYLAELAGLAAPTRVLQPDVAPAPQRAAHV